MRLAKKFGFYILSILKYPCQSLAYCFSLRVSAISAFKTILEG
jgi:hypothetical protein